MNVVQDEVYLSQCGVHPIQCDGLHLSCKNLQKDVRGRGQHGQLSPQLLRQLCDASGRHDVHHSCRNAPNGHSARKHLLQYLEEDLQLSLLQYRGVQYAPCVIFPFLQRCGARKLIDVLRILQESVQTDVLDAQSRDSFHEFRRFQHQVKDVFHNREVRKCHDGLHGHGVAARALLHELRGEP